MIFGAHLIIYSREAEADRAFVRDVLGYASVDAGRGWLIFALPPAELAFHPAENPAGELHLMCDDLDATLADLAKKGVQPSQPVTDQPYGRITAIRLPGGGEIGLYQPRHPMAIAPPR
jgi:hypothetical protein